MSARPLVARQFIVGAPLRQRRGDMLGGEHAGQHRVVAALDARQVDEARRADRPGRRPETASFGTDCQPPSVMARAVADPLAAGERVAHQRMGLEALEFLEWRQIGTLIIEMDDETDRHQVVVEMIENEPPRCGCRAASPSCAGRAAMMLLRRDLPQLLQAGCRISAAADPAPGRSVRSAPWTGCRARPRRTAVLAAQLHAAREARLVVTVLGDAMSPCDAGYRSASNSTSTAAKPG